MTNHDGCDDMANNEIEIKSIDTLLKEIKKLPSGGWIYRGVTDCNYKLLTSIGRIRHKSVAKPIDKEEEEQALLRFKDKVRSHIKVTVENDLEWMIISQHHGAPTRLLDWTRSPLIAAYFAVTTIQDRIDISTGDRTPIDGAVYAAKSPPKGGAKDCNKPFEVKRVKLIDPPHVSERGPGQVSVFTIHAKPLKPWNPPDVIKFLIPRKSKFDIKKELDGLGINEAALFPGIDATARYIGWQLKWGWSE